MTPRQKEVLKQLDQASQGLYYNDMFPVGRKSNMPTLVLKGWATYNVGFGVYEITLKGRQALAGASTPVKTTSQGSKKE